MEMKRKNQGFLFSVIGLVLISSCINYVYAQEGEYLLEDGISDDISEDVYTSLPDFTEPDDSKEKKKEEGNSPSSKLQNQQIDKKTNSKNLDSKESREGSKMPIYDPTTPPTDINENPDPDNPLSFNFLYYIIQKFKFGDVVDN